MALRATTVTLRKALYRGRTTAVFALRGMATATDVEKALKERLKASEVTVIDTSGGCGASFDVAVISEAFEGKRLLERHRLVNNALAEEMKDIHALSIRQCWTPEQQRKAQSS